MPFVDINNSIKIDKIVSLVPSLTELLFDLKLDDKIKGITNFCVSPPKKVSKVDKVGGTKNINIKKINNIKPDLIIASKEENNKEQIISLAETFNVYLTDINDLNNALVEIKNIGKITNSSILANEIAESISINFKNIGSEIKNKKLAFFIWNNPLMVVGNNTFINDIIKKTGAINVFKNSNDRYPVVDIKEVEKLNPEIIFLSNEPYKFTEEHKIIFKNFKNTKIKIVECEYFAWYGSRLVNSPKYINNLIRSL